MTLAEDIREFLMTELNIDAMSLEAVQADHSEWDSLSYLRIMAGLEVKYGLDINADNINKFNSITNIVHEIERQKNNR